MEVTELVPVRLHQTDTVAIKASLADHGYAVIKDAATPAQLEHARSLLWNDLQETHGWEKGNPRTWKDDSFDNPSGGTTRGLEHADFIWYQNLANPMLNASAAVSVSVSVPHVICPSRYVRTLPGVIAGFAAAYGTDDLVAVSFALSVDVYTHGWAREEMLLYVCAVVCGCVCVHARAHTHIHTSTGNRWLAHVAGVRPLRGESTYRMWRT